MTRPARPDSTLLPSGRIERSIVLLRGQKVMLDFHLAALYGVPVRTLNQAVKRNRNRFPDDFMFQLDAKESLLVLRSQCVTSNPEAIGGESPLRSQIVISRAGTGGRRYRPYAFTEQGVAMLSSVLRSAQAVAVNIEIMRAFVRLRQMLAAHADLARKLETLEKKYDAQFKAVFDAIRELMTDPKPAARREIGFHTLRRGVEPQPASRRRTVCP
jgi:hypothetical protein